MHDNHRLVEDRIEELRHRLAPHLYRVLAPAHVTAWQAPGEPVPFDTARNHDIQGDFRDFAPGSWWGPAWSTWWMRVDLSLPPSLMEACARGEQLSISQLGLELRMDLGFIGDWAGNQSEGMVYTCEGVALKALNPMNRTVRLSSGTAVESLAGDHPSLGLFTPDGTATLYVEAAANPNLGNYMNKPSQEGDLHTRSDNPLWQFRGAELVERNDTVWHLSLDIEVLDGLMRTLPEDSTHRARMLRALEKAADAVDNHGIVEAAAQARQILAPFINSGANASAQQVHAVGHAHIDSAWLWPLRETHRKVVRTFSNVVALADEYPDFHFACSSAQHYKWLQEASPQIYESVLDLIRRGQWDVVGGMWVESDTNLPSGESLVRQFTSGLRWMRRELGVRPDCLWLPDSFGYTAALPQIARLAGMRWFFTQKMSWNQTNTLPHHSLWWEGIDGTRIWTHFPPVDCYDSILSPQEVIKAERNFKDKGRTPVSLLPFGYGDGGGGPVREMVERAYRMRDLEDAPRLKLSSPEAFYLDAIDYEDDAPIWRGEMYLEFHRGVYTSNHALKQGNRRVEAGLNALEWLGFLAEQHGASYDHDRVEQLWQRMELLQFHDILPGSSIAWVNREAREEYARLIALIDADIEESWQLLSQQAVTPSSSQHSLVNTCAHRRRCVVEVDKQLLLAEIDGRSARPLEAVATTATHPVRILHEGGSIILDNGLVRVQIADDGTLTSVYDVTAAREVLIEGQAANLLVLHPDHPSCFDAWELQEHYRHDRTDLTMLDSMDIVVDNPLRARVEVTRSFGSSRVRQSITLDADSQAIDFALTIDWQERAHVLKVQFPLAIQATHASGEIQFGWISRPLETNTSWDVARFETSAHRWIHLDEPGYGVAIANESSYGHDVTRFSPAPGLAPQGAMARLTLLRSPSAPDPHADRGEHSFAYSLLLGADRHAARCEGERLNEPLRVMPGSVQLDPLVQISADSPHHSAVVDTIKTAFDRSGDLVIRLHEDAGTQSLVNLTFTRAATISEVDLLEEPLARPTQDLPSGVVTAGTPIRLNLHPFQIVTMKVALQ